MAIGLVLTKWNNQIGPQIKASSPQGFNLSKDMINKILMSHSISKELVPEIIEFRMNNRIILSFSDKSRVSVSGYEMLVLILSEEESPQTDSFKIELRKKGDEIFSVGGYNQIEILRNYAYDLFSKKKMRKLLLIGHAAVGKTSIKKSFFENISSEDLLLKPLEPTYGLVHFTYDWLDLDLGVVDLAGQEIEHYLNDTFEQNMVFDGVDIILYIFDPSFWEDNSDKIISHLDIIRTIMKLMNLDAKLYIFCHKFDLIPEEDRERYKTGIYNKISETYRKNLYFTSIEPKMKRSLTQAMQKIFGTISIRACNINGIINKVLADYDETCVIVFNNKGNVILDISTRNFPLVNLINVQGMIKSAENLICSLNYSIFNIRMEGNNFNFLFRNLNSSNLEKIALISRSLSMDDLLNLYEKIKKGLLKLETSYELKDNEAEYKKKSSEFSNNQKLGILNR